jgi:hypothetical protein
MSRKARIRKSFFMSLFLVSLSFACVWTGILYLPGMLVLFPGALIAALFNQLPDKGGPLLGGYLIIYFGSLVLWWAVAFTLVSLIALMRSKRGKAEEGFSEDTLA